MFLKSVHLKKIIEFSTLFMSRFWIIFSSINFLPKFERTDVFRGHTLSTTATWGEGGWRIAVSNINCDVMLFSNNDIILQSEGEGVKKRPKNGPYMYNIIRQIRNKQLFSNHQFQRNYGKNVKEAFSSFYCFFNKIVWPKCQLSVDRKYLCTAWSTLTFSGCHGSLMVAINKYI